MNTEFVRELRNKLDLLEMFQHELKLAKDAGDMDDTKLFEDEVREEEQSILKMVYDAA